MKLMMSINVREPSRKRSIICSALFFLPMNVRIPSKLKTIVTKIIRNHKVVMILEKRFGFNVLNHISRAANIKSTASDPVRNFLLCTGVLYRYTLKGTILKTVVFKHL